MEYSVRAVFHVFMSCSWSFHALFMICDGASALHMPASHALRVFVNADGLRHSYWSVFIQKLYMILIILLILFFKY